MKTIFRQSLLRKTVFHSFGKKLVEHKDCHVTQTFLSLLERYTMKTMYLRTSDVTFPELSPCRLSGRRVVRSFESLGLCSCLESWVRFDFFSLCPRRFSRSQGLCDHTPDSHKTSFPATTGDKRFYCDKVHYQP